MIFAVGASAVPAAKSTAIAGSISSDNDEEQRSEPGSCGTVPDGYCAVLYDDEDCRGWSFNVPTGSYDLPEDLRNDAEVVVVRAGCKFTGMCIMCMMIKISNCIVSGHYICQSEYNVTCRLQQGELRGQV